MFSYNLFQTQNTVYEIISDMSSRQDAIEERLTNLEDKMQTLQVSIIQILICDTLSSLLFRIHSKLGRFLDKNSNLKAFPL